MVYLTSFTVCSGDIKIFESLIQDEIFRIIDSGGDVVKDISYLEL